MLTETPRLSIRPFTLDDAEAATRNIFSDPEVMRFSLRGPESIEQVQKRIQEFQKHQERYGFAFWAVVLKETNEVIGLCGFEVLELDGQREVELAFRLAKRYWRQGLGFEAAKACIDYGFQTFGLMRIICIISEQNLPSIRIAEKLRMTYEKDSVYMDKFPVRVYSLNRF